MRRFSDSELTYLRRQRLGRLATIDHNGAPQNSAVGFRIGDDDTILIGGRALGDSRKFKNVERNAKVAFLVDDIASLDPWHVRAVEIRGWAEAQRDVEPVMRGMSPERILIHPERVISFGLDEGDTGP